MMDAALSLLSGQSVAAHSVSSPAKAGDPGLRDGEGYGKGAAYWIPRRSLSSGSPKARPGGGGMTAVAEVTPTGPSGNKNLLNFLAYTVNCFSYGPET
jgi:hypothetical protein